MPVPGPRTVFIVRPFKVKEGIDFDAMEARLIRPVLEELGFPGGTTAEFVQAGNIRADMMQELLLADIVLADISIHNANVYYELGVRHALRDRATVLLRCDSAPVPFDLKTERYLEYDKAQPEAACAALKAMIEATLTRGGVDSPVFQLLPEARPHDVALLVPVPRPLREAITLALEHKEAGLLALMASEVGPRAWRHGARTLIGQALFDLKANEAAVAVFQKVLEERPDDPEANLRLATLHERLGDLPRSNVALARVNERRDVAAEVRREGLALLGRNKKVHWVDTWIGAGTVSERQRIAVGSPLLRASRDAYRLGFVADPRSYYAGLNALAMIVIQKQLATTQPEAWVDHHTDDETAQAKLSALERDRALLISAVAFALEVSEASSPERGGDPWLAVSKADHLFLSGATPKRVASAYEGARHLLQVGGFHVESAARQVSLYRDLGLFPELVNATLAALGYPEGVPWRTKAKPPGLVIVATGHRIDAPGQVPRFPGDDRTVAVARDRIRQAVEESRRGVTGAVRGMAALASGADILFHEVCAELGVPTEAYLPLPAEPFKAESVSDGGRDWIQRFDELRGKIEVHVLGDSKAPPPWVKDEAYGVFQRGNLWLLESAFAVTNANVTLVALWNGEPSQGAGGTGDMVKAARERGADVRIIDSKELR